MGFNQEEDGEGGPVHEPWSEVGRVAGANGLVGGEDGEEDGGDGAGEVLVRTDRSGWWSTYVIMSAMKPNMVAMRSAGRMLLIRCEKQSWVGKMRRDVGKEEEKIDRWPVLRWSREATG